MKSNQHLFEWELINFTCHSVNRCQLIHCACWDSIGGCLQNPITIIKISFYKPDKKREKGKFASYLPSKLTLMTSKIHTPY